MGFRLGGEGAQMTPGGSAAWEKEQILGTVSSVWGEGSAGPPPP